MRRDNTENLSSSQKSVWYYPEAAAIVDPRIEERYRYFGLLQSHMLIQDVYTQIIPIGGQSKKESFKIDLVPSSETVEALVASALKSRNNERHPKLASAVADFIQECAQSVMTFGEAVYEIVCFSNPADQQVMKFEFEYVRPLTVTRRHGQFVQIVPQVVVERRRGPSFIGLPADRILIFEPPLRDSLARVLESLAVLSENLMPGFALQNLQEASSKLHFDFANQLRSQKLALAEAGAAIGWNARGLLQEDMLEFYQLSRQLSFERFKIDLRASILNTLNEGLTLAGKQMGFDAQVIVEGLPTISDVEMAQSELESGSKAFGEILKPFLLY
jgi:hypothetical protein